MKDQFAHIAYRRLELLGQIEAQRMEMTVISQHLKRPLAVADVGLKAVHLIYQHPAWVAGIVTALITWRRHGLLHLVKHNWRLLYLYPSAIVVGLKYFSTKTLSSNEVRQHQVP